MKFNPEIMSNKSTHYKNGRFYKVFYSTLPVNTATAEIMNGEHKGKWTTVNVKLLNSVEPKTSLCTKTNR